MDNLKRCVMYYSELFEVLSGDGYGVGACGDIHGNGSNLPPEDYSDELEAFGISWLASHLQ